MEEIINLIHKNGGIAILAHPGVNLKNKEELLSGIIALGIDGSRPQAVITMIWLLIIIINVQESIIYVWLVGAIFMEKQNQQFQSESLWLGMEIWSIH